MINARLPTCLACKACPNRSEQHQTAMRSMCSHLRWRVHARQRLLRGWGRHLPPAEGHVRGWQLAAGSTGLETSSDAVHHSLPCRHQQHSRGFHTWSWVTKMAVMPTRSMICFSPVRRLLRTCGSSAPNGSSSSSSLRGQALGQRERMVIVSPLGQAGRGTELNMTDGTACGFIRQ